MAKTKMKKPWRQYVIHIGRATWHVSRWSLYLSIAALILLTIVFIVAHYLLPMISGEKENLERYLSQRSGHQVRIESLYAYWDGLHPGARVNGLQVFALNGTKPSIRLDEIRLSLALMPMIRGRFEINSLVMVGPKLALEHLSDGRFRISGFDPLQDTAHGADENFVGWLFQQGRIGIENGELQWFDHREAGTAIRLGHVNLSLENAGDRHRLDFSADFPDGMCDNCSLNVDITGNPFLSPDWRGDIQIHAGHINLQTLPLIIREKFPAKLSGRFALQVYSAWEKGRPVSVNGFARVSDLKLPLRGLSSPFSIRVASGDVRWEAKRAGWQLDVSNPELGLSGDPWSGERLRIGYQPDESEIQITHVNLNDVTRFVANRKKDIAERSGLSVEESGKWLDRWLAQSPGGTVNNLNLRLIGDWSAPKDFSFEADLQNVMANPYQDIPGLKGLTGQLRVTRDKGRFQIASTAIEVALPALFRKPLSAEEVRGELSWERTNEFWRIRGDDLVLNSLDGRGTGQLDLQVPHNSELSPVLKLHVDFQNGNGAHAARYYPASHLDAATLAWMERAFLGGEITKGYLDYDGPIREFPFEKGTGKFEIAGHVQNGVYEFLPGWKPISQANVDVKIRGSKVSIIGEGKIGNLDATQVVVQTRESGTGESGIHVGGKVSGALDETIRILRAVQVEPKQPDWKKYVPPGLSASGMGKLSLDLFIPSDEKKKTKIQGEYRFDQNSLHLSNLPVPIEGISGVTRFTEDGLQEGNVHARVLGGDSDLIVSLQNGQLRLAGQGTITPQGLSPLLGADFTSRVSGRAPWSGVWQTKNQIGDVQAEVDLSGLKLNLPAPLDFPEGLANTKLSVRTISARRQGMLLSATIGNRVQSKIALARRNEQWDWAGAHVVVGSGPVRVPTSRVLHLSADITTLNIDQWFPLLGAIPHGTSTLQTRVTAKVGSLIGFDRLFGRMAVDFTRSRNSWKGTVNSPNLTGDVQYTGKDASARIKLDLMFLSLPEKIHKEQDVPIDPRTLPTVEVHSKAFELRGKLLGALDLFAEPKLDGWYFQRFNIERPDMKLSANGRWIFLEKKHQSTFSIRFDSPDMGKTMDAFGAPDQLSGGEVSVEAQLNWSGTPTSPQLSALSGSVNVSAKKGRFLKISSGAGRLFGLLDLSAIGRYLLLDFTPVFGKGLIYDRINGVVSIDKGNATTRNFTIRGPATQLDIGGRVGLVSEDYDLTLVVEPKITDTVTFATWGVLGPHIAAAVLAVQKLFKKQIAEGTRTTYVVKGPWDNPTITKAVKGKSTKKPDQPTKSDDAGPDQ